MTQHSELTDFSMTPTNAPLLYMYTHTHTHTVLHRSYTFQRHLRHPQGALNKDLKLTKIQISMLHRAFFNSITDEYQHMHFFTFNTVLV